jgi:hypothetical protein
MGLLFPPAVGLVLGVPEVEALPLTDPVARGARFDPVATFNLARSSARGALHGVTSPAMSDGMIEPGKSRGSAVISR